MFTIFLVLITIVCFLLIVVIMVQNPKGGGLSSAIGGSQMMGGVQKTTDFLDKSTWTLGALLLALILASSLSFVDNESATKLKDETTTTIAPKSDNKTIGTPAAPTTNEQVKK